MVFFFFALFYLFNISYVLVSCVLTSVPPIPLSCHCNNVATFEKFCCPTESHCLFEATPYASQWTSGCCCKLILGLSVYRLLSKRDKAWDLVRNSKGKTRLAWVCERQKDKEEKQRNLCVCLCRQHYCCLQWMCMCVSLCVCVCARAHDGPGAADTGNAAQLIPEENRALQRRCLADLPSSVWLLLAAGVEKKSGTGSESESAVFNLRGTFTLKRGTRQR